MWVIVVLLVLGLLMGIARRAAGGVDPTQLLLDPELVGRVRALAQSEHQLQAIKMLREGTPGLGLAAAKQMVDRMGAPPLTVTSEQSSPVAPDLTRPGDMDAEMMPSVSTVPLEVELQVRSMKAAGEQISAIELVREQTSWSLLDAEHYVDGLM
jgi:ribosomal protein L7/L12